MGTYANHEMIIPLEVLKKYFPKEIEYLENNEDDFVDWLSDRETRDNSSKYIEICNKIKEWGLSKNLELSIESVCMDEENDNMVYWLCVCTNAYTLNPAFIEIGGNERLWTCTIDD